MKVQLELTAELLEILTAEQQKKILLDIITEEQEDKELPFPQEANAIQVEQKARIEYEKRLIEPEVQRNPVVFTEPPAVFAEPPVFQPTDVEQRIAKVKEELQEKAVEASKTQDRKKYERPNSVISPDQQKEMVRKYNSGMKVIEIAEEYGIAYTTIYSAIHRDPNIIPKEVKKKVK